ncbi:hypothetical protein DFJ58DRAFT_808245, partial [Suillus subalutaceus]|uniref:uncharacterized protein n=1 Tax=Suillus subalutaceus TaxID=48586 RepID=UPI001B875152
MVSTVFIICSCVVLHLFIAISFLLGLLDLTCFNSCRSDRMYTHLVGHVYDDLWRIYPDFEPIFTIESLHAFIYRDLCAFCSWFDVYASSLSPIPISNDH